MKKTKPKKMDEYIIKRLALVMAVQSEIEGMKSENMLREQRNESPAYGHSHFQEKAEELRSLAYAHNDQLF